MRKSKATKVNWVEIYTLWQKGETISDLAKKFDLNEAVIHRRAKTEKWMTIAAQAVAPAASDILALSSEDKISASRDEALSVSLQLGEMVKEMILDWKQFDGDIRTKAQVMKTIIQSYSDVTDIRARAVGDILGQKAEISRPTQAILQVVFPEVIAKNRMTGEIIDINAPDKELEDTVQDAEFSISEDNPPV